MKIYFILVVFSGRASEEEKEIRGCAGGGKGRPVGNGHSGGNRSYLQHSQGCSAMYPGEWPPCTVNFTKSRLFWCVIAWLPLSLSSARMEATVEESTVFSGTLRKIYCTVARMIPTSQSGTCKLARHGGQFFLFCSLTLQMINIQYRVKWGNSCGRMCIQTCFFWPDENLLVSINMPGFTTASKSKAKWKPETCWPFFPPSFLQIVKILHFRRLSWYFHSVAFKFEQYIARNTADCKGSSCNILNKPNFQRLSSHWKVSETVFSEWNLWPAAYES